MLPSLADAASEVFLVRPRGKRGREPESYLGSWQDRSHCRQVSSPEEALDLALATGRRVVVAGSLYLVGELRESLRSRFGRPPAATESLW